MTSAGDIRIGDTYYFVELAWDNKNITIEDKTVTSIVSYRGGKIVRVCFDYRDIDDERHGGNLADYHYEEINLDKIHKSYENALCAGVDILRNHEKRLRKNESETTKNLLKREKELMKIRKKCR